jgi:hypothetical protein
MAISPSDLLIIACTVLYVCSLLTLGMFHSWLNFCMHLNFITNCSSDIALYFYWLFFFLKAIDHKFLIHMNLSFLGKKLLSNASAVWLLLSLVELYFLCIFIIRFFLLIKFCPIKKCCSSKFHLGKVSRSETAFYLHLYILPWLALFVLIMRNPCRVSVPSPYLVQRSLLDFCFLSRKPHQRAPLICGQAFCFGHTMTLLVWHIWRNFYRHQTNCS